MKKFLVLLLILVCCSLIFAACSAGSNEITTEKSGTIGVSVYPTSDNKAELTPIVTSAQKSITDDGQGLYRITYSKSGEGTVSLSSDKSEAGSRITVTATPANKWKLASIAVNGQTLAEGVTSFDMPASDTNVAVAFADRRHVLLCGDHIAAELTDRMDGYTEPAYEILEGDRYYFTVDQTDADHYYEDKDVGCAYYDYENQVNVPVSVRKESAGRYSVVAPDKDVYASVTIHPYRSLVGNAKVYTSDYGWGVYSEEDYTDQCQVTVTANGEPYTMGTKVKEDTVFRVQLTAPFACRVKGLMSKSNHSLQIEPSQTDPNDFTFVLADYLPLNVEIRVKIGKVYTLSCGEYKYGTVSARSTSVMKGEGVDISVTPLYGYSLTSLRYTTNGVDYEPVYQDAGGYYLVMPDADVTVVAEFKDVDTPVDCVRGTILVKYEGDATVPAGDLVESVVFNYGDPITDLAPYGKVYLPKNSDFYYSAQKIGIYSLKAVTVTTDPDGMILSCEYNSSVFGSIRVAEEDFVITIEILE